MIFINTVCMHLTHFLAYKAFNKSLLLFLLRLLLLEHLLLLIILANISLNRKRIFKSPG